MNDKTTSEKATSKIKSPRVPDNGGSLSETTVAALRILVDGVIIEDQIPARGDKPARNLYKQNAIVIGGTRSLSYQLTAFERDQVESEGVYMLDRDALRLNQYGRLELNPYAPLVFVRDMNEKELAQFDAPKTSLSDLTG